MRVPFLDLGAMTEDVRAQVSDGWSALLDSNRFVGGEAVDRFESQWATYCGTACGIGVGNGTDALHLVLRAAGIGPGDEVIVPANSFVATAEAVVLAGATPRFADVDPETLLVTAATAEAALTPRTAALIAVHLYGQMPDMDALTRLARHAGIALIEDAAQAHGATWRGRRAGSFGVAGCFSFYPGKNLGAFGDGGAIVTSDPALADRVRSMRDHGRVAGSHYDHDMLGTNSRLDAVQATVLSAKLDHLDRWNARRRLIAARYRTAAMGRSLALVGEAAAASSVHHLAVVRVERRDEVRHWLATWGIETGVHYPVPIHRLAPYRKYADRPLQVAEAAATEVVSLPMYPHMSEEQVGRVCQALELVDELLAAREEIGA
jgi:dTDP-4-amino-4,6-dideoxygalactose transaminase